MLGGTLALGDVGDVEGLARRALDDFLRARGAHLRPHLYEDALQELLTTAWQLWQRFDPARGLSFSTYCYRLLKLRVVDWYRHEFGDTRYGERPQVLSLDARPRRGASSDDLAGGRQRDSLMEELTDDGDAPIDVDVLRELEGTGALSSDGSRILREIALPLALGLSKDEVATRLGRSRRYVNRCLDELQVEYSGLEGRSPMPKKRVRPKVTPTTQQTVLPPSCEPCLEYVLEQLEKEGIGRPSARTAAERKTRMVWLERGKVAICGICNADVVPNREVRRAPAKHGGWRKPKGAATPLRTPEIEENLRAAQAAEQERRDRRDERRRVRNATERLEMLRELTEEALMAARAVATSPIPAADETREELAS